MITFEFKYSILAEEVLIKIDQKSKGVSITVSDLFVDGCIKPEGKNNNFQITPLYPIGYF